MKVGDSLPIGDEVYTIVSIRVPTPPVYAIDKHTSERIAQACKIIIEDANGERHRHTAEVDLGTKIIPGYCRPKRRKR